VDTPLVVVVDTDVVAVTVVVTLPVSSVPPASLIKTTSIVVARQDAKEATVAITIQHTKAMSSQLQTI
jgi:hypothetical protein